MTGRYGMYRGNGYGSRNTRSEQLRAYVYKESDDKGQFQEPATAGPGIAVWMDAQGSLDEEYLALICDGRLDYGAFDADLHARNGDLDWACDYLQGCGCIAVPFTAGYGGIVGATAEDVRLIYGRTKRDMDQAVSMLREQADAIDRDYGEWQRSDGRYGYVIVEDGKSPVEYIGGYRQGLGDEIYSGKNYYSRDSAAEQAERLYGAAVERNATESYNARSGYRGRRRCRSTPSTTGAISSATPTASSKPYHGRGTSGSRPDAIPHWSRGRCTPIRGGATGS